MSLENYLVANTANTIMNSTTMNPVAANPGGANTLFLHSTNSHYTHNTNDLEPLTNKGDLFTYSTTPTRLPVGANGTLLRANSATATGFDYIGDINPSDNNCMLGQGVATPSGTVNTSLGAGSCAVLTSGTNNTAVGYSALNAVTTTSSNTGIGSGALFKCTTNNLTAVGTNALGNNTSGTSNTAVGFNALNVNITNIGCTAVGSQALRNSVADNNTAVGSSAGVIISTSPGNTAIGTNSMLATTTGTGQNTAIGAGSLLSMISGSNNTAIGYTALQAITTGINNTAVGLIAGAALTGADSNNIDIGHVGVAGDSGVIRIGLAGTHTTAFMQGISGVTSAGAVPVVINAAGQLGTVVSSERYKKNIKNMELSAKIYDLRPVEFDYKSNNEHSYGLIAEEVEKVMPEIVVRNQEGLIETIQYQHLVPMMLNELIEQDKHIHCLEEKIVELMEMAKQLLLLADKMDK
jgi:hypothetical protein